jgi:hypothetical protein
VTRLPSFPSPAARSRDFGDVDFSLSIIAAKTRLASAPPAASASINTRGVIWPPLIKMDEAVKAKINSLLNHF